MFNYLNSILYKSNIDISNIESDTNFQPYLIQRWSTMHSPAIANLINETTNKYWQVFNNKNDWFVALNTVIPRSTFKKINYIKKSKKEANIKQSEYIQKIANTLEISSREVINYIKDNNLKINLPKNNE